MCVLRESLDSLRGVDSQYMQICYFYICLLAACVWSLSMHELLDYVAVAPNPKLNQRCCHMTCSSPMAQCQQCGGGGEHEVRGV